MKYKSLEKIGLGKMEKKNGGRVIRFINKTLTAIFLALVVLIVMEYSPKFKSFIREDVLNNNLSFGVFNKLYNKLFGKVIPESNENNVVSVFNEKITYSRKEKYADGYNLSVAKNYLVPVINNGVIVYIGEKESLGKVITVEQEDGFTVTYGHIKNTDVKLYDYVTKGKFLGEVEESMLYLSVLKNGEIQDIETYLS